MMQPLAKAMVLLGLTLATLGSGLWLLAKLGFRGLPGDIFFSSGRTTVAFPIVTCLLLSLVLSLIGWLWQWWTRG
ncbi:MAG: DUF2905 family protein [Phycisphaeraceae bacterium]